MLENTKALIQSRAAANILLFGDAGTGKSYTVKACTNHFHHQGIQLIELRKDLYATNNRRHIVKETFSDRAAADDSHFGNTVQELMSLSKRCGLTIYFEKPGKTLYLEIVYKLAEKNGITLERNQLGHKAEAFALAKGSRSPGAAEQFIHTLL